MQKSRKPKQGAKQKISQEQSRKPVREQSSCPVCIFVPKQMTGIRLHPLWEEWAYLVQSLEEIIFTGAFLVLCWVLTSLYLLGLFLTASCWKAWNQARSQTVNQAGSKTVNQSRSKAGNQPGSKLAVFLNIFLIWQFQWTVLLQGMTNSPTILFMWSYVQLIRSFSRNICSIIWMIFC